SIDDAAAFRPFPSRTGAVVSLVARLTASDAPTALSVADASGGAAPLEASAPPGTAWRSLAAGAQPGLALFDKIVASAPTTIRRRRRSVAGGGVPDTILVTASVDGP